MNLAEIVEALKQAPEDLRRELEEIAEAETGRLVWVPNPGPQTEAYFSEADELFYGGQAGGGKTDLMVGLAITQHKRSLILRRLNKEIKGLIDRMAEVIGHRVGLNSQTGTWRLPGSIIIDTGGCQMEEDKQGYKGNPHDFVGLDEISDFTETQYRFITGWNRSADLKQRCRVLATGNPPTRPEGLWVLRYWAAWLDPKHPNPAQPGELRWYTTDANGDQIEVGGRGPHLLPGMDEPVEARSRTFIPATLSDNPDLAATNYGATLDSLPAELRAAYRDGNFGTALKDDPYQVIPTEWVTAAQKRWTPTPPVGVPMTGMGVDVAIAKDKFVIAPRHDGWFQKLIVIPGHEAKDAKRMAGVVVASRRDNATVIVDCGGGWGADVYAQLTANGIDAVGYMGVKSTKRKSADGKFHFSNVRTEAIWSFREALDPSQPGGSQVALPPDAELKADLCAPSYSVKGNIGGQTLTVESKEKVCDRLGRSTDRGDAVIMAWYKGLKQHHLKDGWQAGGHNRVPEVNRGRRYKK